MVYDSQNGLKIKSINVLLTSDENINKIQNSCEKGTVKKV